MARKQASDTQVILMQDLWDANALKEMPRKTKRIWAINEPETKLDMVPVSIFPTYPE